MGCLIIVDVKTVEDVKAFFNELLSEGLNFHPDDQFSDYINYETKDPSYTIEEVALRARLLNQCFEVCEKEGADIYELCIEIFMKDFYEAFPPELD